jgi:hypothetical protein
MLARKLDEALREELGDELGDELGEELGEELGKALTEVLDTTSMEYRKATQSASCKQRDLHSSRSRLSTTRASVKERVKDGMKDSIV